MLSNIWIRKSLTDRLAIPFLIAACLGIFMLSSHSAVGKALDPEDAFSKANSLYKAERYDQAASEYEVIVRGGLASGNLYYNLGNCYLKKGEDGRAILNYERARLFIPRDSALLTNHRYAASLMKQRDMKPRTPPVVQRLNANLTTGETIIAFFLIYFAFALFFVLSLFVKRFWILLRIIAMALCILTIFAIVPLATKITETDKSAIVVGSIADAKLEPLDDAVTSFPLYEGMKVSLLKERKFWQKVKRPDGKVGWVKSRTVERINEY